MYIKTGKIIFVSGNFNVLHPGHLRLLRYAKECGDLLVVGVQSDRIAGDGALIREQLRLEGVESNSWVDKAFVFDEPVENVITRLKPDIVVKGKEYESRFNPEKAVLDDYGGQLLFSSGEATFSSVDLIRREFSGHEVRSIEMPTEFLARHGISTKRLKDLLFGFTGLKVCVVGDLIIDEYITCQPLGMSQEDPTIVVSPLDTVCFIGGAGIVAAHAAGLGASVTFVSVTGKDPHREFAQQKLSEYGVSSHLLIDESRPTTLKQRFRAGGKSLLRVSHLHQAAISEALQKDILEHFRDALQETDLLVFSDFNYGCLPQPLVDKLIAMAKDCGVVMAADSQSSSQVGDICRFLEMDLLTPTEREARISARNQEDGLVVLAELLHRQSNAKNILLKLGSEGMLIHASTEKSPDWHTDRLSAFNEAPKDVAGAGDSLLIASAMTLAIKGNIWEAACIGSLAAAVQVSRLGNTPIRVKELLMEMGNTDGL